MIEAFKSRCVQDKCFDRPLASFLHLSTGIMQKRKSEEESS